MTPELIDKIIERLETISCLGTPDTTVTRLVDVLPSNGYIRSTLLSKHHKLKFADGFGIPFRDVILHKRLSPLSDILYLEVPNDYTFAQHEELAKLLRSAPASWVLYSPAHSHLEKYYTWAQYKDGIFFYELQP